MRKYRKPAAPTLIHEDEIRGEHKKLVQLLPKKEESLRRFHPWIFSGAIARMSDSLKEGDLVLVVDNEGEFLAWGHYQIGSIAVRVLSFEDRPIDAAFWEERISEAYALRVKLELAGANDNDMFRLVHGEGDRLPGLIIDVYGKTAVMQAHSVGMHYCREDIAKAIVKASKGAIQNVYYKSATTLPYKADLKQ